MSPRIGDRSGGPGDLHEAWTDVRPPRVLHVIDALVMGGAQALLVALLRELTAGHLAQSLVCSVTTRWADDDLVAAVRASSARLEFVDRGIDDPRLPLALARIAHVSGADVVHSHLSVANFSSRIAAKIAGRPHVTTVHTMPGPSIEDSRARALADGLTARLSNVLVAPSVEVADAYAAAWRVPRSRFRVIPNAAAAVDRDGFDRAAVRAELAPDGRPVVISVARLQPEKGIDELLEAAALVNGARIVVAGDGPERERLEGEIAARGLGDRLALLGHRSDVARLLAGADAFVLPSRHEGLPISLLEAMSAGLPCVATAVGGIPGLVEDGVSGLLVPPRDPAALAAALGRVVEDRDLAAALGAEGRRVVEQRHSPRAVADAYAAVYEELRR